jgi:MATE family multidrug resistance protein
MIIINFEKLPVGQSCVTNFFYFLMPVVDSAFIGHMCGTSALAASSLAGTLFNLAWLFIVGVSSGMEHHTSQAFGANNVPLVNLWTRRTVAVLVTLSAPCVMYLLATGPIATHVLRRTPEQSAMTANFCAIIAISVPALCVQLPLIKYLQAMNRMTPPLVIAAFANVLNVVFNYFFISRIGFLGAAVATVASRLAQLVLTVQFVWWTQRNDRVEDQLLQGLIRKPGELRSCLEWEGVREFLKVGIPGGFMVGMETWGFDVAVLMASFLGT